MLIHGVHNIDLVINLISERNHYHCLETTHNNGFD